MVDRIGVVMGTLKQWDDFMCALHASAVKSDCKALREAALKAQEDCKGPPSAIAHT
jgi:hypothetical protein